MEQERLYPEEIFSTWIKEHNLFVTRLSGTVSETEVEQWKSGLRMALQQIPKDTKFKVFVNIHGFKAKNFDAHKSFRTVLPLTMANFGLKIGYIDLFEGAEVILRLDDGRQCVAIAHAHHDESKMELYQERCSKDNDRYFKEPGDAEKWILAYPIPAG